MVSTLGSLFKVIVVPSLRVALKELPSEETTMDLIVPALISVTSALYVDSSDRGVEVRANAITAYATTRVINIIGIRLFLRLLGIFATQR